MAHRAEIVGATAAWVTLLALLLARPAAAQPEVEVEQHAVEQLDSGVYIRSTAPVRMKVEERCHPACREGERCDIACHEAPCAPDGNPLAVCNQCRWTCMP